MHDRNRGTENDRIGVEFGMRSRNHMEEGSPYRWTPFEIDEVELLLDALNAVSVIAWSRNQDNATAESERANIGDARRYSRSNAVVEAFHMLNKHRNNRASQSVLKDLLRKFRSPILGRLNHSLRVEDVVVNLLRERLSERKALTESQTIPGIDVPKVLSMLDAQILELREILMRSHSWFSSTLLEELGVILTVETRNRLINDDWHKEEPRSQKPSKPQVNKRTQTVGELWMLEELDLLERARKGVIESLSGKRETVLAPETLKDDLARIEHRIAKLKLSLEAEARIRAYAEMVD